VTQPAAFPREDVPPAGPRAIRGEVTHCRLGGDPAQAYYRYLPAGIDRPRAVLVSVHGISRNAREHAEAFAAHAERLGVAVVAPLFEERRFPDYQRIGRPGRGERADWMLESILADLPLRTRDSRLLLTGFSGGAQFAHRFALLHPLRVMAVAPAAAGWYTFPDPQWRFPHGLAACPWEGLSPDLEAALSLPWRVMVGERDVHHGSALRMSQRVMARQGCSRLERARNWVTEMRAAARQHGVRPDVELEILPRCGHHFSRCVRRGGFADRVATWLEAVLARNG
jgi:poly(3-hydroxybutyrate) depolymerase